MSIRFFLITLLGAVIAVPSGPQSAWAADIKTLKVFRDQDTYHLIFEAVVDAPAQKVYQVLSDYRHLDRLSPAIVAITVKPTPQGTGQRVRSVLRSCFLVFCKDVVEVEDVTQSDGQTIAAKIVPGKGDFQGGYTRWRIQAAGDRTQLHYEATRTPAFWVPRLVSSWLFKTTMRNEFVASVAKLECAINERAAGCRANANQVGEPGNLIRMSRGA
jgi:hypothetical protein